jgi:hypothetical protein
MKLLYITNDVNIAKIAEDCGVDIVFIDLETLGKNERQAGKDTVKSQHSIADISKVKRVLKKSEVLVRINPINENSKTEIDAVVGENPDIIMLPMIKTTRDVETFIDFVDGRAKTCLLIETRESVEKISDIIKVAPNSDYYIGLNDLHLSLGHDFMFEPLADGTVEKLSVLFRKNNIAFGFGGVARIGEGMLPAQTIITDHYRLGSTMVILSRTFCNTAQITDKDEIYNMMNSGVSAIRNFEKTVADLSTNDFENNKNELKNIVKQIKNIIVTKRGKDQQ